MPVDDKTLSQTIRQVMEEPAKASATSSVQTAEGISKGTLGETQSGGTPEYVSGIDISTLPEKERTVARKVLGEKGKLLEDGYQRKFAEVAQFKKQREEMLGLGITETEAVKVIQDHVKSRTTAKDVKKEASRIIDVFKEKAATLEERQGFENLEKIIMELSPNVEDIKKELADIKNYVQYSRGKEFQSREQFVTGTLDALSNEYGKEFVDRHREKVMQESLKYIDADPEQILNAIVPPKELKQAILANSTKTQDRQKEKINAVSSPSSGMTSPNQKIDIKATSMKDVLSQVFAKK